MELLLPLRSRSEAILLSKTVFLEPRPSSGSLFIRTESPHKNVGLKPLQYLCLASCGAARLLPWNLVKKTTSVLISLHGQAVTSLFKKTETKQRQQKLVIAFR